jgi:hypothetical protein
MSDFRKVDPSLIRQLSSRPTDLYSNDPAIHQTLADDAATTWAAGHTAPPTVVATMPPRNRRVEWIGDEFEVIAFAVWSSGHISPIIEEAGRYNVLPLITDDTPDTHVTWTLL